MPEPGLDDVAVFARVVQSGGFSAAARVLRAPKSSVSRRVARLEGALGVRLLHRTTRSLTLTEAGRAYYDRVSVALAELDAAAGAAVEEREVPRGTVRLTAPTDVGAEVLPELLVDFVSRYPEVTVDVELSAGPPGLVDGGLDLALSAGRPTDATVSARKLQNAAFRLYAAPDYLAQAGVPTRLADLADHACLLHRGRDGPRRWRLRGPEGEVTTPVDGPLVANDLTFLRRAALAGGGIALLPALVGEPLVRAGRLVVVLADHQAGGSPLYLVYPAARHVPLRVRALRDFLLEQFPT